MKFDVAYGNTEVGQDILSFSSRYKNLQIIDEGEFNHTVSYGGVTEFASTDYNDPLAYLIFHKYHYYPDTGGGETEDDTIWKTGAKGYFDDIYMEEGNLYFDDSLYAADSEFKFYYFIFNQRLNENVEYDTPDIKNLPEENDSNTVMRIAESGKDVSSDDLVYDSNDKNLLLYKCDYSNMSSNYIDFSWRGDEYIYHNLGYAPMTLGFFQWADDIGKYHVAPQYPSFLYKIYDDRIHWQLEGIGDIHEISTLIFSDPAEL